MLAPSAASERSGASAAAGMGSARPDLSRRRGAAPSGRCGAPEVRFFGAGGRGGTEAARARPPPSPRRAPGRRGVTPPVRPTELRFCPFASRGGGGGGLLQSWWRAAGFYFFFSFPFLIFLFIITIWTAIVLIFSPRREAVWQNPSSCGPSASQGSAPVPPPSASPGGRSGCAPRPSPRPFASPGPLSALALQALHFQYTGKEKKKNEEKQPTSLASHNKPALSWLTTQLRAAVKSFWEARRCL